MKKRRMVGIAICTLIAICGFMFAACEDDAKASSPANTVRRTNVFVASAMNIDLIDEEVAVPYEKQGSAPITWASSNPEIATVDGSGNVTPISAGFTYITASAGNSTSVCDLAVTDIYSDYTVINTAEEFVALIASGEWTDSGKKYCLGADIDFEGERIQPFGGWDSKNKENRFNATFDGRGYALMNFEIFEPQSCADSAGLYFGVCLFPCLYSGTVRNLNLIGVDFSGYGFTGGVAGTCESGRIENCFVQGKIEATNGWSHSVPAGGIVGITGAKGVVSNCFIDLQILGGFMFTGFHFGTGYSCYARSDAIGDDGALLFSTDNTGNKNETSALRTYSDSARLEEEVLDDIRYYDISRRWTTSESYMAYLIRPDGMVPDWAMIG